MTSRGKRKPRYGFGEIVMPRRLPRTGTRRQADNASPGRLARRRSLRADPFSTAVSLTAGPMVRIRLPPAVSHANSCTELRKCAQGVSDCAADAIHRAIAVARGDERTGNLEPHAAAEASFYR